MRVVRELVTTQLWWDGGGGQETSKIPSRTRLLSMPAPCEFSPVPGIPALERSDSANGEFNDTRIVSNSADRHVNRLAHTLEVDDAGDQRRKTSGLCVSRPARCRSKAAVIGMRVAFSLRPRDDGLLSLMELSFLCLDGLTR